MSTTEIYDNDCKLIKEIDDVNEIKELALKCKIDDKIDKITEKNDNINNNKELLKNYQIYYHIVMINIMIVSYQVMNQNY